MKLFCSYAFTGEDKDAAIARMQGVVKALEGAGHRPYCPLFDPHHLELQKRQDIRAIFDYAFKNLLEQDALVVIISSDRRSEGQLMEIGAALTHAMPIYVFRHEGAVAPSHLPVLVNQVVTWSDPAELSKKIREQNFELAVTA